MSLLENSSISQQDHGSSVTGVTSTAQTPPAAAPLSPSPVMMTIKAKSGKIKPPPSTIVAGTNTEFHPDFMFCGSCTTCQPIEEKKSSTSTEALDDYLHLTDSSGKVRNNSEDDEDDVGAATHETKLKITSFPQQSPQAFSTSTRVLLVQSLLQPLVGVDSVAVVVVDKVNHTVVKVSHTLQTSQTQLVAALKRGGFGCELMDGDDCTTIISSSSSDALAPTTENGVSEQSNDSLTSDIVRSQFHVGGICCPMEIPAIRNIVKPLYGVETLQINITTKQVYVQHNARHISAGAIAESLSNEGFPSDIIVDGRAQFVAMQKRRQQKLAQDKDDMDNHLGRTTLHVQGRVLNDRDAIILQESLSNIPGIEKVTVNVQENSIFIQHDTDLIDSHSIPSLASKNYTLEVVQTAQEDRQANSFFQSSSYLVHKSDYVESTLVIVNLQHRNVRTIQTIFKHNYTRAQVRAFFANVPSQTIKVEHNPELLPIADIPKLLDPYGLTAHVAVDGKEYGLILPALEDYGPQQQHGAKSGGSGDEMMVEDESDIATYLHIHVMLSGLFWVLSMLSAIGGVLYVSHNLLWCK